VAGVALSRSRNVRNRLRLCICKNVVPVVAGITLIRVCSMTHRGRLECVVVGVTCVTRLGGRNVTDRLAQCGRPVVAFGTASASWRVSKSVIVYAGRPSRIALRNTARVTGIALLGGHYVARRLGLGILAGIGSTVASRAITRSDRPHHIGVHCCNADRNRVEGHTRRMAGITGCRRRNMRHRFACPTGAVMTRCAGSRSSQCVAVTGRQPSGSLVARIAREIRNGMAKRLSGSRKAVVAA
jgi:hypothetical protein